MRHLSTFLVFLLTLQPVFAQQQTFTKIKYMQPVGDKSKEIDSRLIFMDESLEVYNKKTGESLKKIPYTDIKGATYSKSKHPRWKSGAGAAVAIGIFAIPIFFMSGKKHWLTLQLEDDYLILRLDKNNFATVLAAFESRTEIKPERIEE